MRIVEARNPIGLFLVVLGALAVGCEKERPPLPGSAGAPVARTPAPAPAPVASGSEEGVELPLKLEGIGSKRELERALAKLEDPEMREQFEIGFRSSFVKDRGLRRYAAAVTAMEKVLEKMPDFAPAYRVLAYARFNLSFDMTGARDLYQKAVDADPDYGEAHYALAFMLTQFDMETGRKHFERAMELGVPDERNLRENWYPDGK